MPASHDRMTTAVRSASGPRPSAMAVRRPTPLPAIGPSPLAIAYDVSRAARWWAGSPGRIATVTQWGGPGPAMSMPDGSPTVSTRGVRRCARRAQHLAASAGLARGAGSPAARGRDATGTPGRARPLTTNHHHPDDPVPHCCHRRELARSSWGPARQSGRPGPIIIRADQVGPRMPFASAAAAPQPDPPAHPATGPLTPARRACNGPRMPLASAAAAPQPDPPDSPGHWPAHPGTSCLQRHSQATRTRRAHRSQAGRPGPIGAGGAARASDHGPIATSSLRSCTRQFVTVSADHARAAREPVKPCTRCKHPASDIFLGRQLAEFLAPSSLIFSPYCSISPPSKLENCSAG